MFSKTLSSICKNRDIAQIETFMGQFFYLFWSIYFKYPIRYLDLTPLKSNPDYLT